MAKIFLSFFHLSFLLRVCFLASHANRLMFSVITIDEFNSEFYYSSLGTPARLCFDEVLNLHATIQVGLVNLSLEYQLTCMVFFVAKDISIPYLERYIHKQVIVLQ